jgi:hypothetical protein
MRRFMVLFRGLGPQSATTMSLLASRYMGAAPGPRRAPDSQTPEESERILGSMFAGAKVH